MVRVGERMMAFARIQEIARIKYFRTCTIINSKLFHGRIKSDATLFETLECGRTCTAIVKCVQCKNGSCRFARIRIKFIG